MDLSRTVSELPSALARHEELATRIDGQRLALFLDFDGTLTPVAEQPDLAVISESMRDIVAALAERCPVTIVSGRDRADVRRRVGLDTLFYAGSHDACLLSVINKHADVCGMSSRNFDARLADGTFKRESVRIIHTSPPVPPPPLAYSKRLPQKVRDAIKRATLEAHTHGRIGGYGGEMERYVEVKDSDYDTLRAIDRLLRQSKKK